MNQRRRLLASALLPFGLALWASAETPKNDQKSQQITLGKSIYLARCAECHGKEGKGDGPPSAQVSPRPRDLTSGKFKFRSTESGSIPTDDDLINTIQSGLHGTSMPDWKGFLNMDSLRAVVAFIKTLSPRFENGKPKTIQVGSAIPSSPGSIAGGKKVYTKLQCDKCHGTDGNGTGAITREFKDDWEYELNAAQLSEPWTFRGGSKPRDIYLRFRTGMDGSPMPSYKGTASETDMWNLANYVVSLARKPVWSMNEQEVKEFYSKQSDFAKKNPAEWGRYLVTSYGCGFCHSPIREDGSMIEELRLAGGQRWNVYPFGDFVSSNLTSDKETGLGGWTDEQLKTFLTKGIRRDGSRMIPFPMPWAAYASLKEEDLNAIIAFLRTLPPVSNKIPDPVKPGIFSFLWGKFQMLIIKKDLPMHVYAGNAGATSEKPTSHNVVPGKEVQP